MTRSRTFALLTLAGCSFCVSCAKQLPVLSIDPIPRDGLVKGNQSVSGSVTQKTGIREITVYVDAKRATNATVQGTQPSKWRATIDTATMPMGVHYLTVVAHANDGAFSQQTAVIVVSR